jgi:hypothetical protein
MVTRFASEPADSFFVSAFDSVCGATGCCAVCGIFCITGAEVCIMTPSVLVPRLLVVILIFTSLVSNATSLTPDFATNLIRSWISFSFILCVLGFKNAV